MSTLRRKTRSNGPHGGSGAARFSRWNGPSGAAARRPATRVPPASKCRTSIGAGRPRLTSSWLYTPACVPVEHLARRCRSRAISTRQPALGSAVLEQHRDAVGLLAAGAGGRPDAQRGRSARAASSSGSTVAVSAVNGWRRGTTTSRWWSARRRPAGSAVGFGRAPHRRRRTRDVATPASRATGAAGPRPGTPCPARARSRRAAHQRAHELEVRGGEGHRGALRPDAPRGRVSRRGGARWPAMSVQRQHRVGEAGRGRRRRACPRRPGRLVLGETRRRRRDAPGAVRPSRPMPVSTTARTAAP